MPVDRAYIYFFNDNDKPSFHASSGITRNFQPKPSFHALAQMQRLLGDYHFERVITNEPGRLRIQQYQHGTDAGKSIWVVWSQSGTGQHFDQTLAGFSAKLVRAEGMATSSKTEPLTVPANDSFRARVTESPLYLLFEKQ
jgi:hypothetical protein